MSSYPTAGAVEKYMLATEFTTVTIVNLVVLSLIDGSKQFPFFFSYHLKKKEYTELDTSKKKVRNFEILEGYVWNSSFQKISFLPGTCTVIIYAPKQRHACIYYLRALSNYTNYDQILQKLLCR